MHTSLARVPILRDDPDRAWNAARDAWRTQGILVVNPAEVERRAGWVKAQEARNLGEALFGKRR